MGLHVHCDGEGCEISAPIEPTGMLPALCMPPGWRTVSWLEKPGAEESELEAKRAAQLRARLAPSEELMEVPHNNIRRTLLCPGCGAKIPARSDVVGQMLQNPQDVNAQLASLVQP